MTAQLGNDSASSRSLDFQKGEVAKRDWIAASPAYLVQTGRPRVYEIGGVDALDDSTAGLDVEWLADIVEYQSPLTMRTCRPGIFALRPGAIVSESGAKACLDVTFPDRLESGSGDGGMEAIEAELVSTLASLDMERTVFHLSAGLDSSLLVLLAHRLHGAKSVRAVTFRGGGSGGDAEADIVERMCGELHIDLHVLDFKEVDLWSAAERMIAVLKMPAGHPSTLARFLLDEWAVGKGASAVVSGRGADEVFGGYDWHLAHVRHGQHQARIRATEPSVVRALFPGWHGESDRAYKSFFFGSYSLDRRLQYDLATLGADWQFIEAQIARDLNIETIAPFARPDVARAAYQLPYKMKIQGSRQKVAMRDHFSDLYPAILLAQPKRGLTFDIGAFLGRHSSDEILARIGGDWLDAFGGQLELPVLENMLSSTLDGSKPFGWQIWNLYLASLIENSVPGLSEEGVR
ncbi:asparagine synthase [Parvibaculum lavamentivorans]|nr:asparagine synthase [Parvibaculum lavamentivorans]